MTNRKHFLDNLRTFGVLMLLPQHTFMLFNNWGESWYIHSADLLVPSIIKSFNSFWMMPLLFTIAGISSRYALEKRGAGGYAKERVKKLIIPLIFGVLLIVPVQSYIAGTFWNGHAGYFDSFTRLTDLRGYDGAFTVGQLWFLLYLFVIAMISLPFLLLHKKNLQVRLDKGKRILCDKIPLVVLIVLGLLPLAGRVAFDISGISPLEYLAYFLLGYFFLTYDSVMAKLDKYRFLLLGLFILIAGFFTYLFNTPIRDDSWLLQPAIGNVILAVFSILIQLTSWLAVLALFGLARHYLNFNGKVSAYLSKSSFGVYMFHQSWIVIAGYFIIRAVGNPWAQLPLVILSVIILTYATYEVVRRIPGLRWMFGLKK